MASSITPNGKNNLLDATNWPPAYLSLHTDDPGTTGTNEVTGGSPAYARKAATWAAAATQSKALASVVELDVPASTTVKYVGMWPAVTGGIFLGILDVVDESYAGQGIYRVLTTAAISAS